MPAILMNRAAVERAIANAGAMTEQQRRAMWARSRSRGVTVEQAHSAARRAQSAALGSKVVLTDVNPALGDVGPSTPRTGSFTETVRQSPQAPRVTQGNIVPGHDIGARVTSKTAAELIRERNRTILPIPSTPPVPKQVISEQRKAELQKLYLSGGISKKVGDSLIAAGILTPKTGGVVGFPRADSGSRTGPPSMITPDGRRVQLPDRGLGAPGWYVPGGGGGPGLGGGARLRPAARR